ncbi:MAG: heme exporter protein CcmB [Chloroherpetonaceae bacterium]|nr:heme exporter protein CcmB [Chloroherpetonaceae bacterium]
MMKKVINEAKDIFRLISKDVLLESRNKYGFNAILLFVLISVSLVLFSVGDSRLRNDVVATLMWNTIFFAAMTALQRGFISEGERGTSLLLKLSYSTDVIFGAKFFVNLIFSLFINLLIALLYSAFLQLQIENTLIFSVTMFLGAIGTAIVLTLISAIVSMTNGKSGLFAALSFVPILPVIILVVKATEVATEPDAPFFRAENFLKLLTAYDIIMMVLSIFLFEFVWEE